MKLTMVSRKFPLGELGRNQKDSGGVGRRKGIFGSAESMGIWGVLRTRKCESPQGNPHGQVWNFWAHFTCFLF